MKKIYKKIIKDCTQCPDFNEENEYDNERLVKVDFFCDDKKIGTAPKNEKGWFINDKCEIPHWCPLDNSL